MYLFIYKIKTIIEHSIEEVTLLGLSDRMPSLLKEEWFRLFLSFYSPNPLKSLQAEI